MSTPASPPHAPLPTTHLGADLSTTPKQHLPILLHPSLLPPTSLSPLLPPTFPSSPSPSYPSPSFSSSSSSSASQLCVFDLETTFPSKDVPSEMIEFGCLLLSRSGFHKLASFGTHSG